MGKGTIEEALFELRVGETEVQRLERVNRERDIERKHQETLDALALVVKRYKGFNDGLAKRLKGER